MARDDSELRWSAVFRGYLATNAETAAVSTAVIGLNLLIQVFYYYVPEYLRLLGATAPFIGLFGSVAMLVDVAYPFFDGETPTWLDARHALTVSGAVTSLGLLLWLVAPQLDGYAAVPAWGWVLVGVFLVELWPSLGLDATFGCVSRNTSRENRVAGFVSRQLFRWTGLLGVLLAVTGAFVEVAAFTPGFQVLLALAVGVAVTATMLQDLFDGDEKDTTGATFSGFAQTVDDLRLLPRERWPFFIGDTAVRFAYGMVSSFFVTVITSVLRIDVMFLGHHFGSSAFFGVLLIVGIGVALAVTVPLIRVARHLGFERTVAASLLISAFFPFLLVSAPANPLVVALLFMVFGLRLASFPVRRSFVTELHEDIALQTVGSYRLVRDALAIPSAAIGGILYQSSPQLAFGAASAVGLIGALTFFYSSFIVPYLRR